MFISNCEKHDLFQFFSEFIDAIRKLCWGIKFFICHLKKAKFEIETKKTSNHFMQKFNILQEVNDIRVYYAS